MGDNTLIGIFDSGVGGLSVWREIAGLLPHASTLYLADQVNVPYGSRTLAEVRRLAEGITRFLLRQGAGIIVVACNTASAAALLPLRRLFPGVSFVGMEPALKPAIARTRTGTIGVIATKATFQGELFANLMERYGANVRVLQQACPGLVEAVEAGALDSDDTKALLRRYLAPIIEAKVDQLVLGCTHYPFLRAAIEEVAGPGVEVIDPAPAVGRRTCAILEEREKGSPPPGSAAGGRRVFFTTGDTTAFAAALGRLLPAIGGERPEVRQARWEGENLEVRT